MSVANQIYSVIQIKTDVTWTNILYKLVVAAFAIFFFCAISCAGVVVFCLASSIV